MTDVTPRLQLTSISKRYASVLANQDVSLTVLPGEIHALLGENGAGKSTLVKIIYGSVKPDAGTVSFNGQPRMFVTPKKHGLWVSAWSSSISVCLKL